MIRLSLGDGGRELERVLCIGAHCDDIEIGCGGTLLALQATRRSFKVDWVVLSGSGERARETRTAMQKFLRPSHRGGLHVAGFVDGRFPAQYAAIKDYFEGLKARVRPDLIFCHEREDRHQDHRIASEMTWNTFRRHTVLEYEIPKWDGGLGQPNCFVPLRAADARRKARLVVQAHVTQRQRSWFSEETFLALMRLRGVESGSPTGYAEAFHGRKVCLDVAG